MPVAEPLLSRDVPLDTLNTLGLPGRAAGFVAIHAPAHLAAVRTWPEWQGRRLILGGGSNLVLASDYFAGLVLHEAQQIPSPGQVFAFHGFRFEILERQRNQLTRIKVMPPAGSMPAKPTKSPEKREGRQNV